MTVITFLDAYTDKPTAPRAQLEELVRQLKAQHWADPSDRDLQLRIAELEAELQALDRVSSSGRHD
jgi:hypothetical protein